MLKIIKDSNLVPTPIVDLKLDSEPRQGSTDPVTSDGVKSAIDGAVEDASEALQEQIDDIAEKAGSGYTPKGEADVATLNGLSGQENGDLYTMTDSGTLTDGSLAVVAGDTVAWDATNSVWYKAMDYAPAQYGTNEVHNLATTITAFRTGDVIPVDGPSGTAKMSKDALLKETAENALAGNIAPAFDPTRTSENPYLTGDIVIYQGKLRIFKQPHYGAWNGAHVAMSGRDLVNAYKIYMESIENGALNYDREFSFPFVNATLNGFPLDAVVGVGCDITMTLSGDFDGKVSLGALADNQASPYTNIIGYKTTGTTTTVTATFLTHSISFWMSDGHTGGTVTAKLSIRPKKIDLSYLEDAVSDLETRAQSLEELNTITGRPSSSTSKTHTYQNDTLLTYEGFDIGPGNILRVTQSGEYSGRIHVAYFDEGGTRHDSVIVVNGQGSGEYEMPEVSHKLGVWLAGNSSNVGKAVVMKFDVITNVTGEVINEIKRKVNTEFTRNKFKNFSIIGDSYSTYYGWIPSGNSTWYAVDGIDGNNSQTNDVDAVEDTWWHKLSKTLKIGLIRNESWSGSSISYTNYGSVQISSSFVARAEHLDQNNVLLSKPELIIIMGGTNDAWSSVVCGDPMYFGWTTDDLKKFAPALCKLINDLIKWNPQATILNVVNTGFPADYNSAIETITEHYGILNLFLSFSSSDKQNGHPNKSGMTKICNQIIEKLNAS